MSDEVSASAFDAPPPSTEQAAASTATTPPPSSGEVQEKTPAKVNLQEIPEFKDWQRKYTQKEREYQQRLSQLESEQEAQYLATLSPDKRSEFQTAKLKAENESLRYELASSKEHMQREKDIEELSKTYGVDREILENAATYAAAEKLAQNFEAKVKARARQYDEFASRNESAKDSGGSSRATNQAEAKFNKAMADNDPLAAISALLDT